jgi:Do/DeqQ family serine protease
MDIRKHFGKRGLRAGIAAAAVGLLVTGATAWHGLAADPHASAAIAAEAAAPQVARVSIAGGRDSYADVVKTVAPAVVTIRVEGKARVSPTEFDGDGNDFFRRFFGGQFVDPGQQSGGRRQAPRQQQRQMPETQKQHALGSGVVVTGDGYIMTNFHVVDGADDIKVEFTDGRNLDAKVIGTDEASDLALIKVAAGDLHPIAFGNSDGVQVGDVVLAVGNPLGVGQTVTMGIISAKGRQTDNDDKSFEDFLQTDAPINHGNSGGALVNTKGELVGIPSQIASVSDGNIGIGFAIPANMAKHVMTDLRTDGTVRRGQLGVTIQPITSDLAESLGLKSVGGVIVSSVLPNGAADHAGLKRNDIIKSFNGQPVQDINSLRNHVADLGPGATAALVVDRDGKDREVNVKLDERSAGKLASDDSSTHGPDNADKAALGISVEPLTPELAQRAGAPRGTHGVVIDDVTADSRAAEAGLQPGDVIEEVNRQAVASVDDLKAAVKKSADRPVLMLVSRQGQERFVTVRPS